MLTAFGHLEGLGLAETSRNAHDDEYSDDEATLTATTLPIPATLVWKNDDITQQQPSVDDLLVSTELAGSSFLTCTFADFKEVGTLAAEDRSCSLSLRASPTEQKNFTTLIVVGTFVGGSKFSTKPGDEWRWVEPLMAGVAAARVVVLDTVLATKIPLVSAAQGRPAAPFLFQLGTTSFVKSGSMMSQQRALAAPNLPNSILMEGLSGAIMAHCESVGLNAVALISLLDRVVDSTTLVAFESCFMEEKDGDSIAMKARKLLYKNAVKGSSRQLDSMYL